MALAFRPRPFHASAVAFWHDLPMANRMLALALPLLLTGCSRSAEVTPVRPAGTSASAWTIYRSAGPSPAFSVSVSGTASPYLTVTGTFRPGSSAITYHPAVVPVGAKVTLSITMLAYGTQARLTADGLLPDHRYGGHLRTQPCPATPGDDQNEDWLDFTTTPTGSASREWAVRIAASPRSLVLHDSHAGAVACLTLPAA
jgi:Cu-Zn family superoxide dismutase